MNLTAKQKATLKKAKADLDKVADVLQDLQEELGDNNNHSASQDVEGMGIGLGSIMGDIDSLLN